MKDFHALLSQGVVQFDGGFGSMITSMGHSGPCLERLNITHPSDVQAVHAAYVSAGAQIIETHSLGCNPMQLARHGHAEDTAAFARAAVHNARAATHGKALVAFSVGTIASFLRPVGPTELEEAVQSYAVAVQAAAQAGCDLFIIETMMDIPDMRAAILAAKPLGLPIIASYTFQENGRTLTGGTPEAAAIAAEALGVSALGINCSTGPQDMLAPLRAMQSVSRLPIIVQPNAGLPMVDAQGAAHYPLSPDSMEAHMGALLDAGAAGIGGCCGTTPAHIACMSALSSSARPSAPTVESKNLLSSLRAHLPLSLALSNPTRCILNSIDISPIYDAEPDSALLVDITALSAAQVSEVVPEAQTACPVPLLFRVQEREALIAVLRHYAGQTAVEAPPALHDVLCHYGAYAL